jgi:hypothetical protein
MLLAFLLQILLTGRWRALGKVCETVLQVFVYDMDLKKYADQAYNMLA